MLLFHFGLQSVYFFLKKYFCLKITQNYTFGKVRPRTTQAQATQTPQQHGSGYVGEETKIVNINVLLYFFFKRETTVMCDNHRTSVLLMYVPI